MSKALEQFASETGGKLREAYNAKNSVRVKAVLEEADAALSKSGITGTSSREFWKSVKDEFSSGHLLMEKQAASALHDLMRYIEAELAMLARWDIRSGERL